MFDMKEALAAANKVALVGMKSGQEIGFREGMLAAANICEVHAAFFAGSKELHELHQREMETAQDLAAEIRAAA